MLASAKLSKASASATAQQRLVHASCHPVSGRPFCGASLKASAGSPNSLSSEAARSAPVVARGRAMVGRKSTVECRAAAGDKEMVAITGATGLVGSRLASKLASQGYKVRVLTRDTASAKTKLNIPGLEFFSQAQWAEGIKGCDAVVNLAGEPIATRWTDEHKRTIKSSRVNATKAVVDAIKAAPEGQRPKVLISASAVGYYGISQSATYSEESPAGNDYLAEVCKEWEAAANAAAAAGTRVVILRIGIVLAPDGGALGKMLPVFQIFAGGPLGSGKQWMSWVHRDDLVELIMQSINDPSYKGIYNATAPKPVRMSELCSQLGGIMGRPSWLPVPDFALMTLLGEGASVVLDGQRVLPARTQAAGFRFKYSELNEALKNLLR